MSQSMIRAQEAQEKYIPASKYDTTQKGGKA
jgi:hypothetical protein